MLFGAPGVAQAVTAGTLDATYSGDGITKSGFYSGGSLLVDTQGRPIVGGTTLATSRPSLVRYKANGTIDTTFSGDGKVTLPTTGGVNDLAWLGNDILALAGPSLFSVKPNGALDLAYGGGDGEVTLPQAPSAMAVAPGGAVYLLMPGSAPSVYKLVGENVVAIVDVPVFDGGWGGAGAAPEYNDIVLSPDAGAFYVVGMAQRPDKNPNPPYDAYCPGTAATKISTSDFSTQWSPEVLYAGPSYHAACGTGGSYAAITTTNGKLTVVDREYVPQDCTSGSWPHVVRITPDGVIDMNIGASTAPGSDRYDAASGGVALQGTKTVVAGWSAGGCGGDGPRIAFSLWRLTAKGLPDTTFGGGTGFVTTLGAGSSAEGVRISGTKIIAAGGQYTARYQG